MCVARHMDVFLLFQRSDFFFLHLFFVCSGSWFVCIKKNKGVNDEGAKYQQQMPHNSDDRHNTTNDEYIFAQCENNSMVQKIAATPMEEKEWSCRPFWRLHVSVLCATQINEKTITTKGISAWRVCGKSTGISHTYKHRHTHTNTYQSVFLCSVRFDKFLKCSWNSMWKKLSASTPWSVRWKRRAHQASKEMKNHTITLSHSRTVCTDPCNEYIKM